jgi:hypothetical protein
MNNRGEDPTATATGRILRTSACSRPGPLHRRTGAIATTRAKRNEAER